MKACIAGEKRTGGYLLLINTEDEDAPLIIWEWSKGKITDIKLDHEALELLADIFTESGKRGTENGKEERLYS